MKSIKVVLTIFVFFLFVQCASKTNSNIEQARFELDQGNYTQAINDALEALDADPGNIVATRLLASAYFGRSGLDFLDLAEAILNLSDSEDNNFIVMANAFPATADLGDLRAAIAALESLNGANDVSVTSNEDLADAIFDLSMMQAVEHFAIGVFLSDYFDSLDVTQITDEGVGFVLEDLIAFDNRLIASGVSEDESFISEIRQTYCVLEPISGGDGFTTEEYQALVGCELSDDPDTFDTTALTPDIANCEALNPDSQSADVQACYNTDTTL